MDGRTKRRRNITERERSRGTGDGRGGGEKEQGGSEVRSRMMSTWRLERTDRELETDGKNGRTDEGMTGEGPRRKPRRPTSLPPENEEE